MNDCPAPYVQGFCQGEQDAFNDRRHYTTRPMPEEQTWWARGYIDGYTPRSPSWATRSPDPARVWRRA